MFNANEKLFLSNLVADKIDLCEKHIKKFNRDYKYYVNRLDWLPGETLGSTNSDYAKEIKRQIEIEENKIKEYYNLIDKINEA